MTGIGLRDGDQLVIGVLCNRVPIGEVVINVISTTEVEAGVYTDDASTLIVMSEALKSALNCIGYHIQKPTLRKLLNERIAELRAEIADEEDETPPSPADDLEDIPF